MAHHAEHHTRAYYHSPVGWLEIVGYERGLTTVAFIETPATAAATHSPILDEGITQLDEYFRGIRQHFSVAFALKGTPFQHSVWQQLQTIPFGQTVTYHAIAAAIGLPTASRAVGHANMRNPLAILIPCHRVIGKNGRLTGYAGGIWRKEWLLRHERACLL